MAKFDNITIMKKRVFFILSMCLLTSLYGYSQSKTTVIHSKNEPSWEPVIDDISRYTKSQNKSNNGSNSSVVTFKPVSATLTDSQGSFTSQNFNCGNLYLVDNRTSLDITIAGDKFTLYPMTFSPDTYQFEASRSSQTIKFVAYRSSSSDKIYLVISTTIINGQKVVINFKP